VCPFTQSPSSRGNHCCIFYHCRLILLILKLHKTEVIQYEHFFGGGIRVCFFYPSIIFLRFIHTIAYINSSFFFISERNTRLCWTYHNLFIHFPSNGYESHFQFGLLWVILPETHEAVIFLNSRLYCDENFIILSYDSSDIYRICSGITLPFLVILIYISLFLDYSSRGYTCLSFQRTNISFWNVSLFVIVRIKSEK
jgi:hypothetical protein